MFLARRPFTIFTDHKPLLTLFGPDKGTPLLGSPRILRWSAKLKAFQYTLKYRPGAANGNADGLSRLPLDDIAEKPESPIEAVLSLRALELTATESPIVVSDIDGSGSNPAAGAILRRKWMAGEEACGSIGEFLVTPFRVERGRRMLTLG